MIPKQIITKFKNKLTFAYKPPSTPCHATVCFIPGFHSDFISSKKSQCVYDFAQQNQLGFLSWNHREDENASVYTWYQDGLELVKEYPVDFLIGASMGLWISLLIASEQPVKGILGIGGNINFTERWLQNEVPVEARDNMDYIWKRPSKYDERGYYDIPISFLVDSRAALLTDIKSMENLHLIHGSLDKDSSIETAKQVAIKLKANFFQVSDGDHQLSRSQDLDFICQKIKLMLKE